MSWHSFRNAQKMPLAEQSDVCGVACPYKPRGESAALAFCAPCHVQSYKLLQK